MVLSGAVGYEVAIKKYEKLVTSCGIRSIETDHINTVPLYKVCDVFLDMMTVWVLLHLQKRVLKKNHSVALQRACVVTPYVVFTSCLSHVTPCCFSTCEGHYFITILSLAILYYLM
jgi:hypothetical protein